MGVRGRAGVREEGGRVGKDGELTQKTDEKYLKQPN